MKSSTKKQLLAVVILALIAVFVAWYIVTRQTYYQIGTLTQINYTPTTGAPPYLVFTFSSPLDPSQVTGTTAVLKSFTISPSSPTPPSTAAPLVTLLTAGPNNQGPAPFVPTFTASVPNVITTNTLPSGATTFTQPMTITGNGMMWFAVPKKKR